MILDTKWFLNHQIKRTGYNTKILIKEKRMSTNNHRVTLKQPVGCLCSIVNATGGSEHLLTVTFYCYTFTLHIWLLHFADFLILTGRYFFIRTKSFQRPMTGYLLNNSQQDNFLPSKFVVSQNFANTHTI